MAPLPVSYSSVLLSTSSGHHIFLHVLVYKLLFHCRSIRNVRKHVRTPLQGNSHGYGSSGYIFKPSTASEQENLHETGLSVAISKPSCNNGEVHRRDLAASFCHRKPEYAASIINT